MSSRTQLSPQDEKRIRLFTYIAFGLATAHVIVMNLYFRGVIGRGDWVHVMFFDLDEEGGLGTWFSTVILLYAGRLLLRQACAVKDDGDRWYRHGHVFRARRRDDHIHRPDRFAHDERHHLRYRNPPGWTQDGRQLLIVSNRGVPLGSGNIWRIAASSP